MADIDVNNVDELKKSLRFQQRQRRVDFLTPSNGSSKVSFKSKGQKVRVCAPNDSAGTVSSLLHMKRLIATVSEIDKEKKKTATKREGEKQKWEAKQNEFLNGPKEVPDMEETFQHPPGFRFKSNGEVRRTGSKCSNLQSQSRRGSGSRLSVRDIYSQASGRPIHEHEHRLHMDFKKEIEEAEQALEEIRSSKELQAINKKIDNVRSSLTFLRAHANDRYPQPKSYFSSSEMAAGTKPTRRVRNLKPNCEACENRLREDLDIAIRQNISTRSVTSKRWVPAPQGYFSNNLRFDRSMASMQEKKSRKSLVNRQSNISNQQNETGNPAMVRKSAPVLGMSKRNPEVSLAGTSRKAGGTMSVINTRASYSSRLMTMGGAQQYGTPAGDNVYLTEDEEAMLDDAHELQQRNNDAGDESLLQMKKMTLNDKVESFLSTLPEPSTAIPRWRSSTGVQKKCSHSDDDDDENAGDAPRAQRKASMVHKNADNSTSPGAQLDVWDAQPLFDPSALQDVQDLINCRYLRFNSDDSIAVPSTTPTPFHN